MRPQVTLTVNGEPVPVTGAWSITGFTTGTRALCPDLLTLADIGVADNWRGRVVRGFFRLMRVWPP